MHVLNNQFLRYVDVLQREHEQFECCPMGLVVNTEHPHLGASPDGGISCFCSGPGLLEIKCSYKHRDCRPLEIVDPSFYLHTVDGVTELKHTHDYFIQILGPFVGGIIVILCAGHQKAFMLKGLHLYQLCSTTSNLLLVIFSLCHPSRTTHTCHKGW